MVWQYGIDTPMKISDLVYGERFWHENQIWQHCGFYSAVGHIAAYNLQTNERRILSRHHIYVKLYVDSFIGGLGI